MLSFHQSSKLFKAITFCAVISLSLLLATRPAAAQTVPNPVSINFAQQIGTGSPLIFGGTGTPQWQDINQQAWDKLQEVGITFIRQDIMFETFVPNSTVADYKNNVNNIQDPTTWDAGSKQYVADKFINAKKRGFTTMAITDYAPPWLTYNGQQNGVPKDWGVWEDIVKKTITDFKTEYGVQFDYYEIWNEPGDQYDNQFFDVTGSGLTKQQAYDLLYFHTWNAIKAVDPTAKIGGPADYQPASAVDTIQYMLNDTSINNKIDFVSYHYYHKKHQYIVEGPGFFNLGVGAASMLPVKNLLAQLGRSALAVMLSEYNYSCCNSGYSNNTPQSVVYIGKNFIDMLKQSILAAGYFSTSDSLCDAADEYQCFYTFQNGEVVLQPEAYIFRLASVQLGLGKGPSQVFDAVPGAADTTFNGMGSINSAGQPVFLFSNSSATVKNISLNLQALPLNGTYTIDTYLGSFTQDPTAISSSTSLTVTNGSASLPLTLPAWTVVGLKIETSVLPSPVPSPVPSPSPSTISPLGQLLTKNVVVGDANGDGKVDGVDYMIWLMHDNQTTHQGAAEGDFNGDGTVNNADYLIWRKAYPF